MKARFLTSDSDYQAWLATNPLGFVLNVRSSLPPDYAVLHTSCCRRIGAARHPQGAYTERAYRKVVAVTREDLTAWITEHMPERNGTFSAECRCTAKRAG